MSTHAAALRDRLADRRDRLAGAVATTGEAALADLLQRVDTALHRLDRGDWALCAACRIPIEPELLEADPGVSVCFECLTEEERRALERDLEGAARVQRALLPPRHTSHDGWEVAWLWEPKGAVSGDHVDLLAPDGSEADRRPLHVVLGDVSGKGVAASLLQSNLHALFRSLLRHEGSMDELLGQANRLFAAATVGGHYATLVAARLFPDGALDLVNAGHPCPLLADRRGVRPVEGGGLPLGLFPDAAYPGHRLRLAPGQVLLLYTDGWTESARGEEEYGVGRAAAALAREAGRPLPDLLAACQEDAEAFLGGAPRADDLTLLAVRRTG